MDRPLILFLHGFCSSPASWKSRLLGDEMKKRGLADRFVCPQLSPVPDEAIAATSAIIEAVDGPVTLVGSSLGGHYATHLAERYDLKAVLVNPAVVDRINPAKFIGELPAKIKLNRHSVRISVFLSKSPVNTFF